MKENIPRIFRKSKGQIVVEGDINLTSEDGVKIKHGKRFTLCGCTKSKNLPFCDVHIKLVSFKNLYKDYIFKFV